MDIKKTAPEFAERFERFAYCEVVNEDGRTLEAPVRYPAILAALIGCEPQLTSHARGNMNLGKDKAFLIRVVPQCLLYIGCPRCLNAIACVNKAADM